MSTCVACNAPLTNGPDEGGVSVTTKFYGKPFTMSAPVCSMACVAPAIRRYADAFEASRVKAVEISNAHSN